VNRKKVEGSDQTSIARKVLAQHGRHEYASLSAGACEEHLQGAKSTCRVEGASNIEFQCGAHSGQHDGRTLHQAVVCGYDF